MKYQDLVNKYQTEIQQIKSLKIKVDEARAKVDEFEKSANLDEYNYAEFETLAQAWQDAEADYHIAAEKLSMDIEAEYNDVPFSKPRRQGIEKFWRLAGI